MAPLPDSILALLPRSFGISAAESATAPAVHELIKRNEDRKAIYSAGSKPATDFNNKGIQALFALIGIGMVLTSIWFFFWAKNGGFKWREGDWEDYKSTVMRRKGPDGKTLSNATKSTRLGGGSVVHGGSYGAESSVGYTDETGTSADFGEMREVEEGKSRVFGLRGGDGEKKKKRRRDHTNDYRDEDLRDYREEKPARVGGLNRNADGVYTDYSATEPSELGSNVSSKPLVKSKDPRDKKKEAKEKERRAKERMRQAKLIEKNAARTAAAEAKAQKEAEKEQAKKEKAEKKNKAKNKRTETEYTPTEAPISEYQYPQSEAPPTEYPQSEPARIEYPQIEAPPSQHRRSRAPPAEATVQQPAQARRAPPSAAYSFTTGDDTNTVYSSAYTDNRTAPSEAAPESSYYSDYRPNADPNAFSKPPRSSRRERQSQSQNRSSHSASPRKHRTSRPSEAPIAPSDIFTQNNGDAQGHMSYPCHIPGLSTAGSVAVSDSVSQVHAKRERRGRDVMDGYRRGGIRPVGRRDSLSDSDS
ncbi:hypothetical protein BU24DRAFT_423525 [Aaosphaeria arxii CBS 175.79]|uniref:Uncharacterized protein n=1 Tax=Aaosphaeria arxii CBS 175.79 TaxID=1450172 RepID=A0A6A5XMZ8_9PLEO|nr:uncharacterized protein BU24DRAFT_423525 [Aaosphaeria arxii CBS 175.79]KAF2014608.1 hypothetical protein BU24DRAFT_423525 [Aaosphaeria arxii CBS 175.79]